MSASNLEPSPFSMVVQDDDGEEGEIITDDEDLKSEPMPYSTVPPSSKDLSDDESPEEILNIYAKKIELMKQTNSSEGDPKLCRVCKKEVFKYRCPRCDLRSCSLPCIKQHKLDTGCDGVRQSFQAVEKLSNYDTQKSIDDQKFMHGIRENIGLQATRSTSDERKHEESDDPFKLRLSPISGPEKFLINAAHMRRVWLGYTEDLSTNKLESSYHEQFSDTVFWSIDFTFRKQTDDGVVDYRKTVHKIPETIRLETVLKQFFKPRKYGCVVSESDLDMTLLKPFIDRGLGDANIFMKVHSLEDKFYGVLASNTVLASLRNRIIADHPKLIITLNDEFIDMELVSIEKNEELCKKYGGFSHNSALRRNHGNGPPRGNRGNFANRSRDQGNRFNKRRNDDSSDRGNFKRRNQGARHQGKEFDPFEPFSSNSCPNID